MKINSDFNSGVMDTINNQQQQSDVDNGLCSTIKSDFELSALFNKNLEKLDQKRSLEEGKGQLDSPSKINT